MNKEIGLWIDHRKAVVVTITESGEDIKTIMSNMEKHVRFSEGTVAEIGPSEDVRDRQFGNHLNGYYDEILAYVRGANSIQIFGPGEAKVEFEKHLASAGLKNRITGIETVGKLTDNQVAALVRQRLQK